MDALFRVSSWKLSCNLLGIEEKDIQVQIFRHHTFSSNGKQMAHNGSTCPLWCITHKHLLDVGGRGPGLQRQEAEKRTAWTWPQFIPESEPAQKTPSWQQHSSRRWTSYHEEEQRQSFNTMGVYRWDRTGDNGNTSSCAKQRKDTSKGEGKHTICNIKSKSVLTNGKNHSDRCFSSHQRDILILYMQ